MDFVTAAKICMISRYARFGGRSSRSEFWFFQLFLILVSLVTWVIDETILNNELGPLSLIVSIITLIPTFAVGSRRLHDIDKSGWWQLLWLVPLIGWIVLLVWWATKSDAGDNRFGSPPFIGTQDAIPAT